MSDRTITIDLNTPVRLADVPALAGGVFDWWLKELLDLAPAALVSRLPKPQRTATLHAGAKAWRISSNGEAPRVIELDPAAGDKDIADRILEAAPDFSLSRLTVVLPRQTVLQRRVQLPVMPDASLRSAVELQIDRLSPFAADAVRFDARVHERDAVEGTMLVDVVMTPRAPVEALEQRLTALGLRPVAIDVESGNGDVSGFNLRAPDKTSDGRTAWLTTAGFAVVAALAWYVAIYAWGAAREREIAAWQESVEALRPVAARSAALRREVEGLIEPLQIAGKHVPGSALNSLAEVTKILPDLARVAEYRMADGLVDISGLADDAPSLIAKLEASKFFKDVKFRSPVMRRAEIAKDRFEITMKLEQGGGR
ncbi:MAG: PilN domain-containing protein [Micropepsaceae bacterium]